MRESDRRYRGTHPGLPGLVVGLTLLGITVGLAAPVDGQTRSRYRDWWAYRMPPRFPDPDRPPDRRFTFARLLYRSVRQEALGHGWNTDYPGSDRNFMWRLEELTSTGVSQDDEGEPGHVVVRATDDALFDYPFLFMSDAGTAAFDDDEAEQLRAYLLQGGFLWADDFWGDRAWEHWVEHIGRILPPGEYPIVDLEPDHPIFTTLYAVKDVPQIPSIQFWRRSGGHGTSERGAESAVPHLRGINDVHGRLIVVMSHNTDIADGWEREGEEYEFFHRFSSDAYALGINIVVYALTH